MGHWQSGVSMSLRAKFLEVDSGYHQLSMRRAGGAEGAEISARQLHPENLSSLSDQVLGALSGHAALPAFHQLPEGEASAHEIIKRLQVQKVDEGAPFPGGRSIPMLPRTPISWRKGVQV
jgi:hypothetical protein